MNEKKPLSVMGLISLVLSILGCTALIGLIIAIVDLKKDDGKNKIFSKIALGICGFWLLITIIASIGNRNKVDTIESTETSISVVSETLVGETVINEVITTADTTDSSDQADSDDIQDSDAIDAFVVAFNDSSDAELVYVEDFTPSEQGNGHYRTEFRLNAYRDAIGRSYMLGDAVVDIVYREPMLGEPRIRIYTTGTFEQCETIIRIASPIMDSTITDDTLQEALDYVNNNYINGHREANGYYYSELALTLFEDDDGTCDLMLKIRND